MSDFQLYAISQNGIFPLPTSEDTKTIHDLYQGFDLGVYSALRSFEGNKFLGLNGHIARTIQSISLLDWNYKLEESLLREGLHEVVSNYVSEDGRENARVRFDVLPEPITREGQQFQIMIGVAPFSEIPEKYYQEGVKVGFAETLNRENPLAKTADFVKQRQSYTIGTEEAYERILATPAGEILECTSSNFFAVINGAIYTANKGILEGITRKIILEIVENLAIPLKLTAPRVEDIPLFEEAGLSSSSRAMIPIVQIGAQHIGNGRPGPIMKQILAAYQNYIQDSVKTAVE